MEKKKNIPSKQLIAFFLCAVFLSVHVIKIFHHHDVSSSGKQISTGIEQVKKAVHCSICDYHYAKDSHTAIAATEISIQQEFPPYYRSYTSRITSSIGLNYFDRGPPAFA